MKKKILRHLEICKEIKKAGLPWHFIKKCEEENVYEACKMINRFHLQTTVKNLRQKTLEYLVEDTKFVEYLFQLKNKYPEIGMWRIEALIKEADQEKISQFPIETIHTVLEDEMIPNSVLFWYMKYYYPYTLNAGQKKLLMDSLGNWKNYGKRDLKELSEEERNLMLEPAFAGALLCPLYKENEIFFHLLASDKRKLINTIAGISPVYQELNKEQFCLLMEKTEEFQIRLSNVIGCVGQKNIEIFAERWLENDMLLSDLKRLEKILPGMEEKQISILLQDRITYVSELYRESVAGIMLSELNVKQREIIFYGIKKNKKHFLALVRECYSDFLLLPYYCILLDPDFYQKYVNINTLNKKNLKECFELSMLSEKHKRELKRASYTFEELKLLSQLEYKYCVLYHQLEYERSDERLRIFRELTKRKCIPSNMNREELIHLGKELSKKAFSAWLKEELGHIKYLRYQTAVLLLSHWENLGHFVPDVTDGNQILFLLRNEEQIQEYDSWHEIEEHIMEMDGAWKWLKEHLPIKEEFIEQYKAGILEFLYKGGSEILYAFCQNERNKNEEIRRLLTAELMGRFMELKYHEDDLEKEISYPIAAGVKKLWIENMDMKKGIYHVWEEDRLLPVMQIGEIPKYTCMSYRTGNQSECLLSCFDSNKKIIYLEKNGEIVFRAILRLTKGSHSCIGKSDMRVEFADFTEVKNSNREKQEEELILFLERPYYSHFPDEELKEIVTCVVNMVKNKAKKMGVRLVLGIDYQGTQGFVNSQYYIYISASKNGSQYLDSLGGIASVNKSGCYKIANICLEKPIPQTSDT